MVFLGIEFTIGRHSGGTHQWNVVYRDVQYNWRVCFPIAPFVENQFRSHPSLPNESRVQYRFENALTYTSVFQLRRYSVQPRSAVHQALHPASHPPRLLLRSTRRILLADPGPHLREFDLLCRLLLHPDLFMPSEEEDMESRSEGQVLKDQRAVLFFVCVCLP